MKKSILFLLIAAVAILLCACAGNKPAEEDHSEELKKLNIQKVADYLYTVDVDDYDYAEGIERCAELMKGGCAAIRNGDFRGRNYDWGYDDQAYFVIKTPAKDDRHAVLGVCGSFPNLTMDFVDSGEWSDDYTQLAFATLDGVNDAGVVCNILVVPSGQEGLTTGSNPDKEDLCASMVNRYVLDYAGNVDEAIELLKNRNIYMPHSDYMDQEFHWMISDPERTVMVEFINNEMVVLEDEKIATNFYLATYDKTEKTIQKVPEGIERYHLIQAGYDTTSTKEGMMEMLQSIHFSQAYDLNTVPFWYSEYLEGDLDSSMFGEDDLSDGDLTKAGGLAEAIQSGLDKWAKGRNNHTWITVYSAVYDMKNLTLTLTAQEKPEVYEYSLK